MDITEHLYKSNLKGVVEIKLWLERVEERIGSDYGERMGIFKSLDDFCYKRDHATLAKGPCENRKIIFNGKLKIRM